LEQTEDVLVGRELAGRDGVAVVDGGDETGTEGFEAAVLVLVVVVFFIVGWRESRKKKREKKVSFFCFFVFSSLFLSLRFSLFPPTNYSPRQRRHVPCQRPQPRRGVVGHVAEQVLHAHVLGLGRRDRRWDVDEDFTRSSSSAGGLADVVDGGVGRGREAVLLLLLVVVVGGFSGSSGRAAPDARRLADDEDGPGAEFT